MNNSDLRKKAKCLKWSCGVSYKDIATAIDMAESSFYNWISNEHVKLGHNRLLKLNNYIESLMGDN